MVESTSRTGGSCVWCVGWSYRGTRSSSTTSRPTCAAAPSTHTPTRANTLSLQIRSATHNHDFVRCLRSLQFCLVCAVFVVVQCLNRTLTAKNRKYPPSYREVQCIIRRYYSLASVYIYCIWLYCRRPIHERFYFMDGQFRAIEFDAAATTQEVTILNKLAHT